jgi:hypothetical protein
VVSVGLEHVAAAAEAQRLEEILLAVVHRQQQLRSSGRRAVPLGLGTRIGVPEDQQHAIARLEPIPAADLALITSLGLDPRDLKLMERATTLGAIPSIFAGEVPFDDPDVRAADLPAATAITTACDLARLYTACVAEVDGTRCSRPHDRRRRRW